MYVSIATCCFATMQLRIRVHANSLLDYPSRSEKELSERRALEVEDVGSNNLFCRHSSRTENYTHGVGERAARKENARERREKKERQKDWDTCMWVRNNYSAYYRPLLPRKSLTSCWRAEKVRIRCCDSGKNRRKNFSRRAKYVWSI